MSTRLLGGPDRDTPASLYQRHIRAHTQTEMNTDFYQPVDPICRGSVAPPVETPSLYQTVISIRFYQFISVIIYDYVCYLKNIYHF